MRQSTSPPAFCSPSVHPNSEVCYSQTITAAMLLFELLHDKTNKMMCTQRRLGSACASALSDQSLHCVLNGPKDPSFLHAVSEDSEQTGRMIIWDTDSSDHEHQYCRHAHQYCRLTVGMLTRQSFHIFC